MSITAIQNRYDFVYLFDCKDGNPNGDPDAGNSPRIDPQDMHGLVSDVCLKRKIRNYVALVSANNGSERNRIYIEHHGVLERFHKEAYETLKIRAVAELAAEDEAASEENAAPKIRKGKGQRQEPSDVQKARQWMCENFYDVRTFGAVMSLKLYNAGQVRGPVQLSFSRSIDPIMPLDLSITRCAVANEKEKQGKDTTMGRKNLIPYGLYRCHGFVSANLARETGFTDADLQLLWQALQEMFDHDRSASRGTMAPQKLVVFKHESALGNASAHKLFERVSAKHKTGPQTPRTFGDYEIALDRDRLPAGVEIIELV